jgi:hypothetical protein
MKPSDICGRRLRKILDRLPRVLLIGTPNVIPRATVGKYTSDVCPGCSRVRDLAHCIGLTRTSGNSLKRVVMTKVMDTGDSGSRRWTLKRVLAGQEKRHAETQTSVSLVRNPSAGSLVLGFIPFVAMCLSVSYWDRLYPMFFGIPFNLLWLVCGIVLSTVCLRTAYWIEITRSQESAEPK